MSSISSALSYLERVAKNFRTLGDSVDYRTLRHGNTAGAILATADDSGADLIAMETRGGGALKRLLMDAVADKLMRASKVPMLVHRPHVDEMAHAGQRGRGGSGKRGTTFVANDGTLIWRRLP